MNYVPNFIQLQKQKGQCREFIVIKKQHHRTGSNRAISHYMCRAHEKGKTNNVYIPHSMNITMESIAPLRWIYYYKYLYETATNVAFSTSVEVETPVYE